MGIVVDGSANSSRYSQKIFQTDKPVIYCLAYEQCCFVSRTDADKLFAIKIWLTNNFILFFIHDANHYTAQTFIRNEYIARSAQNVIRQVFLATKLDDLHKFLGIFDFN